MEQDGGAPWPCSLVVATMSDPVGRRPRWRKAGPAARNTNVAMTPCASQGGESRRFEVGWWDGPAAKESINTSSGVDWNEP